MTTDATIRDRIQGLIDDEHVLRAQLGDHAISPTEEHARLAEIEAELDQCWDLLRQRAAARAAGADPDSVHQRDAAVVEAYLG
jgi:hypothetical protein